MKIGIIRTYEIDYNKGDIDDLRNAIKDSGHETCDIYVDKIGVSIGGIGIGLEQMLDKKVPEEIDADAAFLRHLGMPKDLEQFSFRLWAVKAMEEKGILVMNEVVNWLLASDKLASYVALAKRGIPLPRTFATEDSFAAYNAAGKMDEMVIKQMRGAMGFGVFRVGDPDFAMHVFGYLTNMNKPIYMQKYLEKKGSGDYRVVVVGGEALGAEFRKGANWKSNVAQGASVSAAKMDDDMREMAIRSCEVLGLECAGIDIALTEDGYKVLDVNPTFSWQGFRKATGIDVSAHIIRHLVDRAKG